MTIGTPAGERDDQLDDLGRALAHALLGGDLLVAPAREIPVVVGEEPAAEAVPGERLDAGAARAVGDDADDAETDGVSPESSSADVADPDEAEPTLINAFVEWTLVIGAAVLVALLMQHFVVQVFSIPSESMVPTLMVGDRVAVNRVSYVIGGGVERGDVIVFKRPKGEATGDPNQPEQFIKRVIGLPGDVVEAREGVVYIDGKPLRETGKRGYLSSDVVTNNLSRPVVVPPNKVFVLGDNRERSRDSRFFGAVPESDIIGRALVVAWPFDRWSAL